MESDNWLEASLDEQEIRTVVGEPGDGELAVDGVAPLAAERDRCLYFVEDRPADDLVQSLAGNEHCILLARRGLGWDTALDGWRVIEVDRPRAAMAMLLRFIIDEQRQVPLVAETDISEDAVVSPLALIEGNVRIGPGAVIEAFCTIGPDVVIGAGSRVRSGARIGPRVTIGARTTIGLNAILGSEGYGFERGDSGEKARIPHLGGVWIGSDAEIGAITIVQSGTIVPTVVEDFVKMGDSSGVGHNARIRRGASIVGAACIGGSVVIGANSWIGINSTVRNGVIVGERVLVGMDCSVQEDLPDRAVVRAPRPEVRVPRTRRAPEAGSDSGG